MIFDYSEAKQLRQQGYGLYEAKNILERRQLREAVEAAKSWSDLKPVLLHLIGKRHDS